jgi:hypothetical protein
VNPVVTKPDGQYLTEYRGLVMSAHDIVEVSDKLLNSFPDLTKEFVGMLVGLMVESGFTVERARDAIKHVCATCEYPRPTMAKFLGFDRSTKLYTYNEMNLFILNNHGYKTDNFERIAELNKWVMK